jgi:putative peptidoglycan lipid II flippase
VIVSAIFLRRLLGHLDGPRIASSYIRMGYAALGSALAGAVALWLLGSYNPDGYAWSDRIAALVTIVVVGPVMLAAYFLLLKLFRVTELQDLLQPLFGRLRRRAAGPAAEAATEPQAGGVPEARRAPERATVSVDTGLIPRISGGFDAESFRVGPDIREEDSFPYGRRPGPEGGYLPAEDLPSTAQGGLGRGDAPLPGRRTYQGPAGHNPYFPFNRKKKK